MSQHVSRCGFALPGRLILCALFVISFAPGAQAQTVRRDLRNADLRSYQRAVAAMKNLPPSDPHSWTFQANIHGFPAGSGTPDPTWGQCQHASWWFLPWHRAYLHFAERIMRRYSGDPAFALPFWNYADPQQRTLPAAFRNPASPLYDATRRGEVNNGADAISEFIAVQSANQALATTAFADFDPRVPTFGGPAMRQLQHRGATFGTLENLPHNWVHGFVGGNMTNVDLAARDPIFFSHHANIDRLWELWLQLGGGRANPTGPTFLNQTFTFYDENKQRVTISVRQLLSTSALGYTYEGLRETPVAAVPQQIEQSNLVQVASANMPQARRLDTTLTVNLTPTQETRATSRQVAQQSNQPTRVYLSLGGVRFAPAPDSAIALFVNLPGNGRTVSPADLHFAGYISIFGDSHHHHHEGHAHDEGASCTLDITETVIRLHQAKEWNWNDLKITLERVCPGTQPSAARSVLTFRQLALLAKME